MKSFRLTSRAALICATPLVIGLAACGSDTESSPATTPSVAEVATTTAVTAPATPASACPTAAPQDGGTPDWSLAGATGNVEVTGSTDTTAPAVNVGAPFSVTETQVQTLQPGDGPVVADTATVSVCYMGVNGRDGSVFDNSYERGAPVEFPLDGVVPGFQKAIAGQKGRLDRRRGDDLGRRLPRRSARRGDRAGRLADLRDQDPRRHQLTGSAIAVTVVLHEIGPICWSAAS
ncbi:hypothetical protein MAGR_00460 [Mycolicibacterium agri]|uniref:Peptidyl-prolyl cis-trans isomerase n=1 Tax=Mycolicibacterium agri TaxID=36811 RepID=A0A7I9VT36_MYCAG|nr:hypothetical protein MAGR_00460 [Mycolicibacterium agri]